MATFEKTTRLLSAVYPIIFVLTGVAIMLGGICSIVVLTKFASFSLAWVYHLAVISIFIATMWWFFYFVYKGLKLFDRQGIKKEVRNGNQDRNRP